MIVTPGSKASDAHSFTLEGIFTVKNELSPPD